MEIEILHGEERTPEDVRKIIKIAKLHESELTEITQVLRFPEPSNHNDNLKLMLLDDNLLKEIEAGNELVFKDLSCESLVLMHTARYFRKGSEVKPLIVCKLSPETCTRKNYKLNGSKCVLKFNQVFLIKNVIALLGDPDENVVLCTSNKTYDVKEAETSNSLLLVPDLLFAASTGLDETIANNSMEGDSDSSFEKSNTSLNKSTDSDDGKPPRKIEYKDVLHTFFTYYELKPCKPRLSKLRKLLEPTRYRGLDLEYATDKSKLLDYQGLFDQVQASKAELDVELDKIQAVKIDGFYRLLEFDYEFRVLSYMLDLIDENSWPLDRISKEVTLDSLKDLVPPTILEATFRFYTEESVLEDGIQYYKYKEDMICRFLARVLLKSAGKFNLAEFMQAWRDSVPDGMTTHESQLCGIAIIDKNTTPQVIWGFSEADLPEDINERFKVLFQTKTKWTVNEISPYIELYATEKLNVNALLTKYARASTQDGVRVFSAKHMK